MGSKDCALRESGPLGTNIEDSGNPSSSLEYDQNSEDSPSSENSNYKSDSEGLKEVDLVSLVEGVKHVTYKYQYLDHPADVILLGEGDTIKQALESTSVALFNYMSDLSYVEVKHHMEMKIRGRGLLNFLYHFLDECLYLYSSEYFIAKHVLMEQELLLPHTDSVDEFDNHPFEARAIALGDFYNKDFHKSGTEIKAITMHYLNFNLWIGGRWYEYKNDVESQGLTVDVLEALEKHEDGVKKCKIFALVDI